VRGGTRFDPLYRRLVSSNKAQTAGNADGAADTYVPEGKDLTPTEMTEINGAAEQQPEAANSRNTSMITIISTMRSCARASACSFAEPGYPRLKSKLGRMRYRRASRQW
jgi:hypothetical protein